MNNQYYNIWKFRKAISFMDTDPISTRELLEDYILEYPKDYNGKTYYIYCLITLNEIDKATDYILNLEKSTANNCNNLIQDKYQRLKKELIIDKIKIMAAKEKYQEIYDLINTYPEKFKTSNHTLLLLCKVKLGLLDKLDNTKNLTYIEKQIINYSEEKFRNHIKKHLPGYNEDGKTNVCTFSEDFNIDDILVEIKSIIPSDKKMLSTTISDYYIFKFNDCGREDGKITDYFKVVCHHNSNKIITMYPICVSENIPHVDLNYLADNKIVNIPSQIEKFNKRYNKKL